MRAENPNKEIRLLNKDGTSLLNLKEAGLEGAEWLAAVTDFDEANYEACRLARSVTEQPTAIGVVRRPEAEEKLKEAGAEVLVRPAAVAGLIKNRIERAHQVATGVGLGEGEILEIPVLRTSPAVDVRVQDLRARRWLVAAIYRDDSYVVPHGHVVIREGDRLLLTGQPDILPHIADYLRAGVARFPLQYGVRAVAVGTARPTEAFWEEVRYIFNNTRSRALRGLATKSSPPPNLQLDRSKLEVGVINETDDIATIIRRDVPGLDCGLLIVPKHRVDFLGRAGLRRPWFGDPLDAIACPMLLAAGSHPYRRILLPIIGQEAHLATEVAIDVSRQLHVEIAAVIATPPTFIVGAETVAEQNEALKAVMEIGALYHVKIEQIRREGNPAKEIASLAGDGDLVVISHRVGQRASFFNPDTVLQIIVRSSSSVLAMSYRERVHGAS